MKKKLSLLLPLLAACAFLFWPKKQTRVYVDVVGDLFHSGHVEFFKKAKEQGTYLIVGVLSDETVKAYKREPILNMQERVKVIASCRYVDEVIPNCPLGVTGELLEKHKIDLVVHGDDFDEAKAKAQYAPAIEKNMFRLVGYTEGISTTDIMDRILQRNKNSPLSLQKKDFFEGTKAALKETP